MTITLQANDFTINALNGVLDSRNPQGTVPNQNPVIDNIPDQIRTVGTAFSIAAYCSDPDGDSLQFTRVGGTAPAGVTMSTAGLVVIAASVIAGSYTVQFQVSDGRGASVQSVFNLTATAAVAGSPSISSVSGTVAHGNSVTLAGSGFGTKSIAAPLVWAPMDGTSDPSSLGRVASWTGVQSMGYAAGEGYNGRGSMKATDSSGSWVAGVIASGVAWNAYGQRMYCFRRVKRNFDVTDSLNWKIIRFWPAAITTPDWFIQAGNSNLNVEGVEGSDTYPYDPAITSPITGGNIAAVRGSANVWRTEEILMKANSAASAYDGEFYHYVLGSGLVGVLPHTTYQNKTIRLRSSDAEANMTLAYPIHGVKANTTFPSDYRYWVDDVYLDTDWARVMVGNAPTYSACTFIDPQPPSAWSDGSVTVNLNLQNFPSGQTRYLFVVNQNNTASAGYSIGVHP